MINISELLNDDHSADNISITGQAAEMISVPDAMKILQNALHTSVHMQILSGNSPRFDYRFLPLIHVKCIQRSAVSVAITTLMMTIRHRSLRILVSFLQPLTVCSTQ